MESSIRRFVLTPDADEEIPHFNHICASGKRSEHIGSTLLLLALQQLAEG